MYIVYNDILMYAIKNNKHNIYILFIRPFLPTNKKNLISPLALSVIFGWLIKLLFLFLKYSYQQ